MNQYRVRLTEKELELLEKRVAVVNPHDYCLEDFATLRNLYGRFIHLRLRREAHRPPESTKESQGET